MVFFFDEMKFFRNSTRSFFRVRWA